MSGTKIIYLPLVLALALMYTLLNNCDTATVDTTDNVPAIVRMEDCLSSQPLTYSFLDYWLGSPSGSPLFPISNLDIKNQSDDPMLIYAMSYCNTSQHELFFIEVSSGRALIQFQERPLDQVSDPKRCTSFTFAFNIQSKDIYRTPASLHHRCQVGAHAPWRVMNV